MKNLKSLFLIAAMVSTTLFVGCTNDSNGLYESIDRTDVTPDRAVDRTDVTPDRASIDRTDVDPKGRGKG